MSKYDYSEDDLENFDESYKIVARKFFQDLDEFEEEEDETKNIFKNFIANFLSPFFWEFRLAYVPYIDQNFNQHLVKQVHSIHEEAIFHFQFYLVSKNRQRRFKFVDQSYLHRYMSFGDNDLNFIFDQYLEDFVFPHSCLKKYMEFVQRLSAAPITKALTQKYEKALSFLQELKKVEKDDDKKWFELILKWDDEEFIVHNIEYRISQNLHKKDLWKFYIDYLQTQNNNPKAMLGVYSRYCRFFLDDLEAKSKFEEEAKKLGIKIETDKLLNFEEFASISKPKIAKKPSKKSKEFFNLSSAVEVYQQQLSFPNPLINYISKNPIILQKLFFSCKFFFAKFQTPICHRLVLARMPSKFYLMEPDQTESEINFEKESLTISSSKTPYFQQLKNLYLTNYLFIGRTFDRDLLLKVIPCIYCCSVKYLKIEFNIITLKEYFFLTKEKTVKEIKFTQVKIVKDNENGNQLASFEDCMKTLTNAYQIDLQNSNKCNDNTVIMPIEITTESIKNVWAMKRSEKIRYFSICVSAQIFDPFIFFDFIKENMDKSFTFDIAFEKANFSFWGQCLNSIKVVFKSLRAAGLCVDGYVNGLRIDMYP